LPAKALASEPGFFSRELSVRRSQIGEDLSKAEMKFIVVESLFETFLEGHPLPGQDGVREPLASHPKRTTPAR
jgi:hypothetical protein